MSSEKKSRGEESGFSFGTRELRQARALERLEIQSGPLKMADEDRGGDPYNTSGSFDRKNNWSRVGKR